MRQFARVLVAVTSVLTVLFVPLSTLAERPAAAGTTHSRATDTAFVDGLLFDTPISRFSSIAATHLGPDGSGDTWFDWSTDLCSAPLVGNTGRSFNFTEACRRHDFGYRNSKLIDNRYGSGQAWNHDVRKQIDRQFLADMLTNCAPRRFYERPTCTSWAYTYYSAVRVAGGP